MALDWKKEVSFGKKGGSKAPKGDPVKDYINLAGGEKKQGNVKLLVIKIVVAVIAVALFAKFGVFDFFAQIDAKRADLAAEKQTSETIKSQLADYDDVVAEYETYGVVGASNDTEIPVDIVDAMELVHTIILPKASVGAIDLNGDTLTLVLNNVTLRDVGSITNALSEQDVVKDVSVSTAGTQDQRAPSAEIVTATMKIKLISKDAAKKDATTPAQGQSSAASQNANAQSGSGSSAPASSSSASSGSQG